MTGVESGGQSGVTFQSEVQVSLQWTYSAVGRVPFALIILTIALIPGLVFIDCRPLDAPMQIRK